MEKAGSKELADQLERVHGFLRSLRGIAVHEIGVDQHPGPRKSGHHTRGLRQIEAFA